MKECYPISVACICKGEYPYLREFVDYHLLLGFDKIIIADNNDMDGERYDTLLGAYVDMGKVVVMDYRGRNAAQLRFYNEIIAAREYEWCAFIDADEFLTLPIGSKFRNIKEFLRSDIRIKAYKVNWMVFGDCGQIRKTNGNVVDRFVTPQKKNFKYHYAFSENAHVKSILHRDVWSWFKNNPHVATNVAYNLPNGDDCDSSPFNMRIDYNTIYIRHYYTKSLEEWMTIKNQRGFATRIDRTEAYPIEDYFIYNDLTKDKIHYLFARGYLTNDVSSFFRLLICYFRFLNRIRYFLMHFRYVKIIMGWHVLFPDDGCRKLGN